MARWRQRITFAAISAILFAPRADQAYTTAIGFMIGSVLTVAIAATLHFAVLPNVETFAGFSLIIGFCPGAGRRCSRPAVAAGYFHRNGDTLCAASRAHQPDELRHTAIL